MTKRSNIVALPLFKPHWFNTIGLSLVTSLTGGEVLTASSLIYRVFFPTSLLRGSLTHLCTCAVAHSSKPAADLIIHWPFNSSQVECLKNLSEKPGGAIGTDITD